MHHAVVEALVLLFYCFCFSFPLKVGVEAAGALGKARGIWVWQVEDVAETRSGVADAVVHLDILGVVFVDAQVGFAPEPLF